MVELKMMAENIDFPCIICSSPTAYFFSKTYPARYYPDSPFSEPLAVDYWRCGSCGFVLSKTHHDMEADVWAKLNETWHHAHEGLSDSGYSSTTIPLPNFSQPPYAEQALALKILERNGILNLDNVLDYAAGYGTLAKFLAKYFDIHTHIYDKYVENSFNDIDYVAQNALGKYKLVMNSAMFEHVLTRDALDEVNSLVADAGVLMLHTVVCENVPPDPNWFYIAPMVHTAFHTNKSMEILMRQWGYVASIYSPQAKSWFLFKENHPSLDRLERVCTEVNREIQSGFFYYKPGFVDYWKGF